MRHDLIERFETAQSLSYRDYSSWKESKWGEDRLDEVEIDDEDVYLELSLPWIFANPLIQFPPLRELLEALYSHLAAHVLSLFSMITNLGYYYRHPMSIPAAIRDVFRLLWPSSYLAGAGPSGVDLLKTTLCSLCASIAERRQNDEEEEEDDEFEEYEEQHGGPSPRPRVTDEEIAPSIWDFVCKLWWKYVTVTTFLVACLIAGSLSACVLVIAALVSCFIPATWLGHRNAPYAFVPPITATRWHSRDPSHSDESKLPASRSPSSGYEYSTPSNEEGDRTVASLRDRCARETLLGGERVG